jgi:DNA-binding transcriptional LysR family regulator
MHLNEISVFVKVVQAGSFTQAARQLGIPNSTASARVAALERRLGVTLLKRTTRKLRLTEEGEAYFRQASQGLETILQAETEASSAQREAQGTLRVTAPNDLGGNCMAELLSAFRKKYPKVNVELFCTERIVDLVAEGVDLAIRAGELRDSGLIARKVGSTYWVPVASPAYLRKAGTPAHPKELRQHACLQFTPLGKDHWQLTDGKHTVTVPLAARMVANEMNLLKALAACGDGIALLPTYLCHGEMRSKKLVRILPRWRARVDPIHLVYPGQRFVAPKVRAFVDMAVDALQRIFRE